MDRGRNQTNAEDAAFNTLLPISRRRLWRIYLLRLKWVHRIKHDALHHKVKKTFQRFIDGDDMNFYEVAEKQFKNKISC